MIRETSRAPVAGSLPAQFVPTPPDPDKDRAPRAASPEARLIARVFDRCHAHLRDACAASSLPEEFLGALVANESGGNPNAARFEPSVYRHLQALAAGDTQRYAGLTAQAVEQEVADMLHPKAGEFHARALAPPFAEECQASLAALPDEALRELATSWGYTQIMGYHMVRRDGTVRDLLDPTFHFRLAIRLLAEFMEHYQLDPRLEFAELFACWNTGRPYGRTYDPRYVERGLARMELYRRLAAPPVTAPALPGEMRPR